MFVQHEQFRVAQRDAVTCSFLDWKPAASLVSLLRHGVGRVGRDGDLWEAEECAAYAAIVRKRYTLRAIHRIRRSAPRSRDHASRSLFRRSSASAGEATASK